MMDNQFGVSTPGLDILSYSDSVSYVNILCNRLLGSPVSPDCVTEVTPVTRVTTAYITNTNQVWLLLEIKFERAKCLDFHLC